MDLAVRPARGLKARLQVPGDKALSHRAAILLALSRKGGGIRGFSSAADAASTLSVLEALGVDVRRGAGEVRVGGGGLRPPAGVLDCANSGSTMRMMAGALAARPFEACLDGDASLRRRPMERVAGPLREMGASLACEGSFGRPPLRIRGGSLKGIAFQPSVPSAQVKTAVLLAGLSAEGRTSVEEALPTRDHTERMLGFLGVAVGVEGRAVFVEGPQSWEGRDVEIPGDPSSAAFFLCAAAGREGSRVEAEGLCLNPGRIGYVAVLKRMGAAVSVRPQGMAGGEPVGTITVEGRALKGTYIPEAEVPSLIDELPALAVAASQALGETRVEGASELKVKESDRIAALVAGLGAMGARMEATPDGFIVRGPARLRGAVVDSCGDHRIAMALAVAGTMAEGASLVRGAECIAVSLPEFEGLLAQAIR